MDKKKHITFIAFADNSDFDSFLKFYNESRLFSRYNIDFLHIPYKSLLNDQIPSIQNESIIIFFFFPFEYWNSNIEPKNYKGIYANASFYKKFVSFFTKVESQIKKHFRYKQIFFINSPFLSCKYRDKLLTKDIISKSGIPTPRPLAKATVKDIEAFLGKDKKIFIKPKYGSMGKGITFLSKTHWNTNFVFRKNRILSKKSDYGWKFRPITNNIEFLKELLKRDFYAEEAIDSLVLDKEKFDLRIYVFFHKVVYIYPRSNDFYKITTNISQGGKGHTLRFIKKVPPHLIRAAQRAAIKTTKALGLNFAGVDVILDKNQKNVYVFDVNVFPGFPKKKRFDLSKRIIERLGRAYGRDGSSYFRRHLRPFIGAHQAKCKRRVVIFDYDSRYLPELEKTVLEYNSIHPENCYCLDIYKSRACLSESDAGKMDLIIHSGGDGRPVKEDIVGVPKLYICHSHQWKAIKEGGHLTRLMKYHIGVQIVDVVESNDIIGKRGKLPIGKYSCLAIVKPPKKATVLATSNSLDHKGEQIKIIEALLYSDGSISVQGHPEEGTAAYIIYNFLNKTNIKIHSL